MHLKPSKTASNTNNTFTVTVDGKEAAGETINFAMFSLFPPTFKGRANGMRMDVAQVNEIDLEFNRFFLTFNL